MPNELPEPREIVDDLLDEMLPRECEDCDSIMRWVGDRRWDCIGCGRALWSGSSKHLPLGSFLGDLLRRAEEELRQLSEDDEGEEWKRQSEN